MTRRKILLAFVGLLISPMSAVAACTTKLDMFGLQCKPITKAAPKAHTSYQMIYNFEGDFNPTDAFMRSHLRSVHHIDTSGMSRDQMAMAHDRAHGVAVRAAVPRIVFQPPASTCPGGVCPTGPSSRRRR